MTGGTTRAGASKSRNHPRYPEYRHSGVEFLGYIPAHWDLKRLKLVAHTVAGQSPPSAAVVDGLSGLAFLQGNAEFGSLHPTPHLVCDSAAKRAEAGDILLSIRAPVGAMNIADRAYGIGRGLCAIRPAPRLDRDFCYYEMMATRLLLGAVARGSTYDAVTASDVGDLPMLLPRPREQRDIVDFLDHETAKIDALVARKERLLELLQEKRTALITRAVTRGLDPDVSVKDSGVAWLGDVPAHWEVKPLKWATTFQRGHDLPSQERQEGDVPVVSSSGVSATHSRAAASAPGIVTGRYGTIGRFHLIAEDYWPLNTTLYTIDLRGNRPRFLAYMLSSLSSLFIANAQKSAVPGVDRNDIHPIQTAIPSPSEQGDIADFLDRETRKVDALVDKIQEAIGKLNELRTALISAAVTGRIDVRQAGSRLDAEL